MSLFLSLQGSMAAGKTTVARYLEACLPEIHVSYEENRSVIEEIRRRGLNKINMRIIWKFKSCGC